MPVQLDDHEEAPLSGAGGDRAPAWFRLAVAAQPERGIVEVAGATISFRCWGPPGDGAVLVHGATAHAGWWDHLAPLLADGRRIVAVDLSGHGDSDHRPRYQTIEWAEEVLAAAVGGGVTGQPVLIGHSMGGQVSMACAAEHGDSVAGVVTIDSRSPRRSGEQLATNRQRATKPRRVYDSVELALTHFHPIPPDPFVLPYVERHVAAQSLRRVSGGWTWKFDPGIYLRELPTEGFLSSVRSPVALLRSEFGLLAPDEDSAILEALQDDPICVDLPAAGHHAMLDQPLAVATTLRALLQVWRPVRSTVRQPATADGANWTASR